jgi:hypothetical protein
MLSGKPLPAAERIAPGRRIFRLLAILTCLAGVLPAGNAGAGTIASESWRAGHAGLRTGLLADPVHVPQTGAEAARTDRDANARLATEPGRLGLAPTLQAQRSTRRSRLGTGRRCWRARSASSPSRCCTGRHRRAARTARAIRSLRQQPRALGTPILPGICPRPPAAHDAAVLPLARVIDLFDEKFVTGLSDDEKAELVAFIEAAGQIDEPCGGMDDRGWAFQPAAPDERTTGTHAFDAPSWQEAADSALLPVVRTAGLADAPVLRSLDGEGGCCWLADTLADARQTFRQALCEKSRTREPR